MMRRVRLGKMTHLAMDMHGNGGVYWCTRCTIRFKRVLGLCGWKTEDDQLIVMDALTEIDCMACITMEANGSN